MFGYTWIQIFWYFLVYSFIGWCVEVVYCTVTGGKPVNRGFLNGPVCPVYGCGMIVILCLLKALGNTDVSKSSFLELFLGGMILASLVEFIAGWALMKLFHARWWDYSMRPFNIGGYVCLQFSICWGLGCVFAIRVAHSAISDVVESSVSKSIPALILLAALYVGFAVDLGLTLFTVIGLNKKLKELDEMSQKMRVVSNEISQKLGTDALKADARINAGRVQAALAKAELRDAAGVKAKEAREKRAELAAEAKMSMERRAENMEERMESMKEAAGVRMENMKSNAGVRMENARENAEARMAAAREMLEKKWEQTLAKPGLGTGRLLKAFPTMRHNDYQHILDEWKNRKNKA